MPIFIKIRNHFHILIIIYFGEVKTRGIIQEIQNDPLKKNNKQINLYVISLKVLIKNIILLVRNQLFFI